MFLRVDKPTSIGYLCCNLEEQVVFDITLGRMIAI
jgi:hypothetical protein